MAAKRKKSASKAKPATSKPAKAVRVSDQGDIVANFIAYAQANPAITVVGLIVVLVALVLFFK